APPTAGRRRVAGEFPRLGKALTGRAPPGARSARPGDAPSILTQIRRCGKLFKFPAPPGAPGGMRRRAMLKDLLDRVCGCRRSSRAARRLCRVGGPEELERRLVPSGGITDPNAVFPVPF